MLSTDTAFEEGLLAVLETGEPTSVAALTDFTWDEMGVVPEGTTASAIEGCFGARIIRGERYVSSANLFVFREGGRVVRAIMVVADRFNPSGSCVLYDTSVTVAPDPSRPTLLQFRAA